MRCSVCPAALRFPPSPHDSRSRRVRWSGNSPGRCAPLNRRRCQDMPPGRTPLANLTRQRCRAVVTTGRACDFYSFIWMNCAPPKVKFFGWLLVQDRIQTKENLLKKHCVDSDVCEVCGERTETSAHRIVGCVFAAGLWRQIGMSLGESDVGCLWDVHPPTYVPA